MPEEHGVKFWVTRQLEFSPKAPDASTSQDMKSSKKSAPGKNNRLWLDKTRKVRAMWNIASEFNLPVLSVGWMVSDPVEKVNGIQVSFNLNKEGQPAVYPHQLQDRVNALSTLSGNDYVSELYGQELRDYLELKATSSDNLASVLNRAIHRDIAFKKIYTTFSKEQPWTISALYTRLIDVTQHMFYKYTFPEGFSVEAEKISRFKEIIPESYRLADKILGTITRLKDPDTLLLVLSDHGIRSMKQHPFLIDVDVLLKQVKKEDPPGTILVQQLDIISEKRIFTLDLPEGIDRELRQEYVTEWKQFLNDAFIIQPENEPLFSQQVRAIPGEKIRLEYRLNPKLGLESTITCEQQTWKVKNMLFSPSSSPFDYSGVHLARPSGIFLAMGKDIKKGVRVDDVHVLDVLPTILAYLDLPVASDMPGSIREDLFTKPLNPVKKIDTYEKTPYEPELDQATVKDEWDSGQIEELKMLGYIQ